MEGELEHLIPAFQRLLCPVLQAATGVIFYVLIICMLRETAGRLYKVKGAFIYFPSLRGVYLAGCY